MYMCHIYLTPHLDVYWSNAYIFVGQKAWQSARSAWVRGIHYDSTIDDDWTSDVDHVCLICEFSLFGEILLS